MKKYPNPPTPPQKKRGTRFGFSIFKLFFRISGLYGAYFILLFPCAYYLLFDREARNNGLAYITHRFPKANWIKKHLHLYRLFISQGMVLIDRNCMIHKPDMYDVSFDGYESIRNIVENREDGFILVMSHMGNWQAILTAITHLKRPVCLLMRPEDNPAVKEVLSIDNGQDQLVRVSPTQFLGGVVELMKYLQAGYLVSIMGDRSYDHNALTVDYLGGQATFPYGAFSIASSAHCPIIALTSAKTGMYTYEIQVELVLSPVFEGRKQRRQQLQKWVQTYARALEKYTEKHPYQCFLFHDIWNQQNKEENK